MTDRRRWPARALVALVALVGLMGDRTGPRTDLGPTRTLDDGLVFELFLEMLRDIRLSQEGNGLVLDDQSALFEVDTRLVAPEHVQTQEQVDVFSFHDRERARQEHLSDFDLRGVDPTKNVGGADPLGDTTVATINEAHDVACDGAFRGHDGHLRTGVDEGVQFVAVDLHGDVKHCDAAERWGSGSAGRHTPRDVRLTLGVMLHGGVKILGHGLLAD